MSVIMVSTCTILDEVRSSLMADKRGEVAGRRVERAMGIQGRPPSLLSALRPRDTS